jgi:spermidine/putrescine transport system permease protein
MSSSAAVPGRRGAWLLLPSAFWLTVFFVMPLLIVVGISLVERGRAGGVRLPLSFTPEHYVQLADSLYLGVFWSSVRIAVIVTLICLFFGYLLAFAISLAAPGRRNVLLLLVMIPFWTNFLVRTYALKLMLASEGAVNAVLQGLGLVDQPLALLFNSTSVIIGLVYGYLPFAVLPMYASIEKFDRTLLEAAADLGANQARGFLRVMLPLTLPGVAAATVVTFVPVLGAFITPDIMGGGKVEMIGTIINRQFGVARNWPFGSAMSLILMLLVVAGVLLYLRNSEGRQGDAA